MHRGPPSRLPLLRALPLNQERLRANWRPPRGEGGGAAREGRALFRALSAAGAADGGCRSATAVRRSCPHYSCVRGHQLYGTERCQPVGGRRIEQVVLDAVFEALARPGSRRRCARSSTPPRTTRRGCARPSSSSSGPRPTPSGPAASSTAASRRTGSSLARWSASGSSG